MRRTILSRFLALALFACLGEQAQAADVPLDILIVYTNQADQWYGADGVESHAQLAVASANEAFANSNAGVRLRLAGVRKVSYNEKSAMADDLRALTNDDGAMDEVFAWRNEVGADLVCLFRAEATDDTIGTAWRLDDTGGDADRAFSVLSIDFALSELVLQHEVGHNLGAAHDRDNSDDGGLYSYSYGHRFLVTGGWQARTVMAYEPGYQINYFSNPSIRYEGAATGVASGSNSADNARTFRNVASVVGSYRAHQHQPPIARAGEDVVVEDEDGDGQESVELDASASFTEDGSFTARWTWPGGSANGATVSAQFPVGARTVTLTITDSEGHSATDSARIEILPYSPVVAVFAGHDRTFFLKSSGALKALGRGDYYGNPLGIGGEGNVWSPTLVPLTGVKKVVLSAGHTVFLRADGTVFAAGQDFQGRLGIGTSEGASVPAQVAIQDVVDVAAFANGSLYLKSDGSLWAAGARGGAGYGAGSGARPTPEKVVAAGVSSICAGLEFSAALHVDGSVWALGRIGYASMGDTSAAAPLRVFDSGVAAIAAGLSHLVALMDDGSVWAIGGRSNGGASDDEFSSEPALLVGSGARGIAAVSSGTAVFMDDGSVWATGYSFDALFASRALAPPRVLSRAFSNRLKGISGGNHLVALKDGGAVWGIGSNSWNQLGVIGDGYHVSELSLVLPGGSHGVNSLPVPSAGPDARISDATGRGATRVTLDAGDSSDDWALTRYLWTWPGGSAEGQLVRQEFPVGDTVVTLEVTDDEGAKATDTLVVSVSPYVGAETVSTAGEGILIVKRDGSLWAVGRDFEGSFGAPQPGLENGELRMLFPEGVSEARTSGYSTVVIKDDGSLWAASNLLPKAEDDGGDFFQVADEGVARAAPGYGLVAYVKTDGSLWAMGYGFPDYAGDSGASYPQTLLAAEGAAQVEIVDGGIVALWVDGSVSYRDPNVEETEWTVLFPAGIERIGADPSGLLLAQDDDGNLQAMSFLRNTSSPGFGSGALFVAFPIPVAAGAADFDAIGGSLLVVTSQGGLEGAALAGYSLQASNFAWTRISESSTRDVALGGRYAVWVRDDGSVWGAGGDLASLPGLEVDEPQASILRLLPPEDDPPSNAPPVARAGPDIAIESIGGSDRQLVALDGSASSDDLFVDEWEWSWDGGSASGSAIEERFPIGTTNVTLTVRDRHGAESSDELTVTVLAPPRIRALHSDGEAIFYETESGRLYASSSARPALVGATWRSNREDGARYVTRGARSLAVGGGHDLIVGDDGSLSSYGVNFFGQLGIGTCQAQWGLERVLESGVEAAAAGARHSLALMQDGSVWGAGSDDSGQLGLDGRALATRFEKIVESGVVAIAAGDDFSIFVRDDGSAWQIGRDLSAPADPEAEPDPTGAPRLLFARDVVEAFAGNGYYILQLSDGSLWGGGADLFSDYDWPPGTRYAGAPIRVLEGGARKVAVRRDRVFALLADGSLWGMGRSGAPGVFGMGSYLTFFSPERLLGSGVADFATTIEATVALRSDGAVYASGQLGGAAFLEGNQSDSATWRSLKTGDGSWSNVGPTADAGSPRVVYTSGDAAYVIVTGAASRDDWAISSWRWAPPAFSNGSGVARQIYLPVGEHLLSLEVLDEQGLASSDTVTLTVLRAAEYDAWLLGYFEQQTINWMGDRFKDDSDLDGISNEFEKILGLDPSNADSRLALSMVWIDGEFALRVSPASEAVDIQLWTSPDLARWSRHYAPANWSEPGAAIYRPGVENRAFFKALAE